MTNIFATLRVYDEPAQQWQTAYVNLRSQYDLAVVCHDYFDTGQDTDYELHTGQAKTMSKGWYWLAKPMSVAAGLGCAWLSLDADGTSDSRLPELDLSGAKVYGHIRPERRIPFSTGAMLMSPLACKLMSSWLIEHKPGFPRYAKARNDVARAQATDSLCEVDGLFYSFCLGLGIEVLDCEAIDSGYELDRLIKPKAKLVSNAFDFRQSKAASELTSGGKVLSN